MPIVIADQLSTRPRIVECRKLTGHGVLHVINPVASRAGNKRARCATLAYYVRVPRFFLGHSIAADEDDTV